MSSEASIEMRANPASNVILVGISAFPLIICLLAAIKGRSMWAATLICLTGVAGLLFWLRSFRLGISDEVLRYTTLFGGTKTVELRDIASARVEVGYSRYRDRFKPPLRLVVSSRDGRIINVNMKVFRACEVEQLLSVLGDGQSS